MPDSVKTGIDDFRFHDFFIRSKIWKNLLRVDSISTSSPYVRTNVSHVFYPVKDNGRLLIWAQGHDGSFYLGQKYIRYFLARGYTVAAFSMPALEGPALEDVDLGEEHDRIGLFEHPGYSPIQEFLNPVAIGLNYLLKQRDYQDVTMVGLSGGGWTTTVYAAVDPRIDNSYPVAGSLPFYLRALPPNDDKSLGDWEQTNPALYEKANLLEMYVLAASSGRRQMQVLNQYDTCCFAGVNARSYEHAVSEKAATLGGEFSLYLDPNYTHSISDTALEAIAEDLDRRRP
jgi:pimeloyl-ACP methyl ester carboxylesterase